GTQLDFRAGSAKNTGQELDLLIDGPGFFQVQVEPDVAGGFAFTRAGNFTLNANRELVLATDQGRRMEPPITIPDNATGISISADGVVSAQVPGEVEPTVVGNITIASFVNPSGLKQIGENLYVPSAASGPASIGDPRTDGRGALRQGFL